jgi:hypothetical protein
VRNPYSEFSLKKYEPAPIDEPTIYPGKRPNTSFLFHHESIFPIHLKGNKFIDSKIIFSKNEINIKKYLEEFGKTRLEDYFLIVGYGSNINPAQLSLKFHNSKLPIPVLKAHLKGYDIVYASMITSYGAIPATIEKSNQTTVEVWVNMLNAAQLKIMDKTESRGINYFLVEIDGEIVLENGERFSPVYLYLSAYGNLSHNGKPIRLSEVKSCKARFESKNQKEILNHVLKKFEPNGSLKLKDFVNKVRKDIRYRKTLNEFLVRELSSKTELESKIIPNDSLKRISDLNFNYR